MTVHDLPAVNASLNGLSAVLLYLGWRAIRAKNQSAHKAFMLAALATSALFLTTYLYYHFNVQMVTRYGGQGLDRYLYFFILITHVILAPLVVPFSIAAVVLALRGRFDRHVRITKWLWPAWMYVSVTGVVIYVMLYLL